MSELTFNLDDVVSTSETKAQFSRMTWYDKNHRLKIQWVETTPLYLKDQRQRFKLEEHHMWIDDIDDIFQVDAQQLHQHWQDVQANNLYDTLESTRYFKHRLDVSDYLLKYHVTFDDFEEALGYMQLMERISNKALEEPPQFD